MRGRLFSWCMLTRVLPLLVCVVATGAAAIESDELEKLEALGYVSSHPAEKSDDGVLRSTERAQPGFNLYTSGHAPCAFVMDMSGELRHRWCDPAVIGEDGKLEDGEPGERYWRRVELLPDGVLAIYDYRRVVRLDDTSRVIWSRENGAHHDLDVHGDAVWTLASAKPGDEVDDRVEVLDLATGELRSSFSLLELVRRDRPALILRERADGDVLHTNALSFLDPPRLGGELLVSFRTQNAVAVVALDPPRIAWSLSGLWQRQHEPVLLPGGTLLVYDNQAGEGFSRIVEIDPLSQETVWELRGDGPEPFYSHELGIAQRLANGNTLIAESTKGRALEVTPEGEVAWEWQSPHWKKRLVSIRGQGVAAQDIEAGWRIATLPFIERLPLGTADRWTRPGPPAPTSRER